MDMQFEWGKYIDELNSKTFPDLKIHTVNGKCDTLKSNNKNMNFIEQYELDKFTSSKKMNKLKKALDNADIISTLLETLAIKLSNMSSMIGGDRLMLGDAVDRGDIAMIERILAELEAKIDIIDEVDFAKSVNTLSTIFGIRQNKNKVDKKSIKKSLGFVS